MLHIHQLKNMRSTKRTESIDILILNKLNNVIKKYIIEKGFVHEYEENIIVLLIDVARIIMDKLTGMFPSVNYSKDSVNLYLALRRACREEIKRRSLRKAIWKVNS
jgi:hypothetical protein